MVEKKMVKQNRQNRQNRNDLLLGAAVLLLALLGLGLYQMTAHRGERAVVYVDGALWGSYPLSEDAQITIGGTNLLVIGNGRADMVRADCPDGLCVRQPAIFRVGESIVCLPNRIVVTVEGKGEAGIDAQAY